MFNFDSDQQEVDFSYYHIVQVIFVLVVLEFDVKAVFNPNLSRKLKETRNKKNIQSTSILIELLISGESTRF